MASPSREARKTRSNNAKAIRLARARRRRNTKIVASILIIALIFGGGFGILSLSGDDTAAVDPTTQQPTTTPVTAAPVPAGRSITGITPCPATNGSEERASSFEQAPPMCIDPAKTYTATFDTTEGKVVVALDAAAMPNTVNNFVTLARYKYYDGSAIVRTNTGIDIIQSGGPSTQTNGDPGPGYTVNDEGGPFTYTDGDLVMARTSQPNSTGAQFFFVAGPNGSQLDGQGPYLKIGKATEGGDVLDKILALHAPTDPSDPTEGAPSELVIINSISIAES